MNEAQAPFAVVMTYVPDEDRESAYRASGEAVLEAGGTHSELVLYAPFAVWGDVRPAVELLAAEEGRPGSRVRGQCQLPARLRCVARPE